MNIDEAVTWFIWRQLKGHASIASASEREGDSQSELHTPHEERRRQNRQKGGSFRVDPLHGGVPLWNVQNAPAAVAGVLIASAADVALSLSHSPARGPGRARFRRRPQSLIAARSPRKRPPGPPVGPPGPRAPADVSSRLYAHTPFGAPFSAGCRQQQCAAARRQPRGHRRRHRLRFWRAPRVGLSKKSILISACNVMRWNASMATRLHLISELAFVPRNRNVHFKSRQLLLFQNNFTAWISYFDGKLW